MFLRPIKFHQILHVRFDELNIFIDLGYPNQTCLSGFHFLLRESIFISIPGSRDQRFIDGTNGTIVFSSPFFCFTELDTFAFASHTSVSRLHRASEIAKTEHTPPPSIIR
jgi:hypothetical protein